jgi:4,5-dihydroxyphthalate decarboxylase
MDPRVKPAVTPRGWITFIGTCSRPLGDPFYMPNMASLSVAIGRYDRTQPLLDGRVRIAGADANFESPPFEVLFERAYDHEAYDVAELSFSNFIYLTSIGRCPYVGLPIFPSKMFRHSAIFIRTDRGIKAPADLAGRLIGVREYAMTAAMTARGVLADEYGVPSSAIRWRYGRAEADDRQPIIRMLPKGFDIAPLADDGNLSDALARGDIDALVAYKPPSSFKRHDPNIARLFPDHEKQEADYFVRTGIFPLMHLIGVRRQLMQKQPELCRALCDAFEAAKQIALYELAEYQAITVSHPWAPVEAARLRTLFGDDTWTYGVHANRASLEALARWSFTQGVTERQIAIEELFPAAVFDWRRR